MVPPNRLIKDLKCTKSIADLSAQNLVNLRRRVFNVLSPNSLYLISTYFISCIVNSGIVIPETFVDRVLQCALSPENVPSIFIRWLKKPRLSLK